MHKHRTFSLQKLKPFVTSLCVVCHSKKRNLWEMKSNVRYVFIAHVARVIKQRTILFYIHCCYLFNSGGRNTHVFLRNYVLENLKNLKKIWDLEIFLVFFFFFARNFLQYLCANGILREILSVLISPRCVCARQIYIKTQSAFHVTRPILTTSNAAPSKFADACNPG